MRPSKRSILCPWNEQIRMVADLLQLHQDVHHSHYLIMLLVLVGDELVVKVSLSSAQGASDDHFCLLRKLLLNVLFKPPKEEWPQYSVEFSENLLADGVVLL